MPLVIPRLWHGEPFIVVGAGPSLCKVDTEAIILKSRARLVVVNDAWQLVREADVIYAADAQWWQDRTHIHDWVMPPFKFTAQPSAQTYRPSAILVNVVKGYGISTDPSKIHSGGHGGHQAINLAVHLGASSIVLLGFDFQPDASGRHHFFGEHPNRTHVNYEDKIRHFSTLAADLAALDIPIVNCSRATAIDPSVIPRRPLAETLRDLAAQRRADGSERPRPTDRESGQTSRLYPDTPEADIGTGADDLHGPAGMD